MGAGLRRGLVNPLMRSAGQRRFAKQAQEEVYRPPATWSLDTKIAAPAQRVEVGQVRRLAKTTVVDKGPRISRSCCRPYVLMAASAVEMQEALRQPAVRTADRPGVHFAGASCCHYPSRMPLGLTLNCLSPAVPPDVRRRQPSRQDQHILVLLAFSTATGAGAGAEACR